jgi:hypothetical protein
VADTDADSGVEAPLGHATIFRERCRIDRACWHSTSSSCQLPSVADPGLKLRIKEERSASSSSRTTPKTSGGPMTIGNDSLPDGTKSAAAGGASAVGAGSSAVAPLTDTTSNRSFRAGSLASLRTPRKPKPEGSLWEMFRVGPPRTFSGSLIDESALGSKQRDASLEDP